jgi:G3E family GTPase
MPVPILLIVGFLGAGKTTVVNRLLANADGRRIAAVVNDFGSINIDADLIAGAEGGVVSLANGCICCSLEGDLLRTLASLMRRTPRPETIVIETSGIADPTDIVRNLMDPVIFREAPLETVLCVVDASGTDALEDALLQCQIRSADLVALSKVDLADRATCDRVRAAVLAINARATIVEARDGDIPMALLFPPSPDEPPAPRSVGRRSPSIDRFETITWVSNRPVVMSRFQMAIERLSPKLARAKGFFEAVERPGSPFLLQLAGGRAMVTPAGPRAPDMPFVRMVFIAELGALQRAEIDRIMAECVAD